MEQLQAWLQVMQAQVKKMKGQPKKSFTMVRLMPKPSLFAALRVRMLASSRIRALGLSRSSWIISSPSWEWSECR
jgi:hypothetical protein